MRHRRKDSERGQGLVEYALILVLVGIVVIIALTTAGEKIRDIFCDVVINLDPSAAANTPACAAPRVSLSVSGGSPGTFQIEAIVKDDKMNTPGDILSVKFYVDGSLLNTEVNYKFCLEGGDTTCNNHPLSGTHTIRAVAEDKDHNTGETSITMNF